MSYQALYRVWRPHDFTDLVGQAHITQTLQNALKSETYTHAYLFSGPRGTGKTSTAKIVAKAVNCEQAPVANPCLKCASCLGIAKGSIVDVVEIDAASNNGVDEIRDLRDKVKYAPTEVQKKVYIIDEVHMLSQGAFNALLKTLEEPPSHVMFILATTEPHKIPLTIVSRCQRFDFRRVSRQAMMQRLHYICEQEKVDINEEALQLLAQVAQGGMRDALSMLDQASSFAEAQISIEDVLAVTGSVHADTLSNMADVLMNGQVEQAIRHLNTLMNEGKDPQRLVEDLIYYFRDILVYRQAPDLDDLLERAQVSERWTEQTNSYTNEHIFKSISRLSQAQQEMKWTHHPQVYLEVAFVQLSQSLKQIVASPTVEANVTAAGEQLERRLTALERQLQQMTTQAAETTMQHPETAATSHAPAELPGVETPVSETSVTETTEVETPIAEPPKAEPSHSGSSETEKADTSLRAPKSRPSVKNMLHEASKVSLVTLQQKWPDILDVVRTEHVKVHAWLRDGEPVAGSSNYFLLAFRSDIHRETTERPEYRQIIEEIVSKMMNHSSTMMTIMYNDWEELKQQFILEQKGDRIPEEEPDPFYDEAIKLVGKDLVQMKEDD